MATSLISRRHLMHSGGGAMAGYSVLRLAGSSLAFQSDAEVIPWLDQPEENPVPEAIVNQIVWEELDSWITPNEEFFIIKHFNAPELNEADWQLQITGLVDNPLSLTLAHLRAREQEERTVTLECSGNSAFPFNKGLVSNAAWTGVSLASLLEEAGIQEHGREVVFWGADAGEQVWREATITEQFARSMSVSDAMAPENLIATEMNGEQLPHMHGFPARLIAPGWYGVANVKWLTKIEVRDSRYQGNFMARDYVTIREEAVGGESVWTFTSVGRGRLKSAPARVTRTGDRYSIMGAAWGAQVGGVDVRIDDGAWQPATLTEGDGSGFTWTFWTMDWDAPAAGEHTVTSRAIDADGAIQPAADDPYLTARTTYWENNGQITRQILIS
ncbi:MAG: sulfite oxidase [Thermomicrobiales bacterium]|nr:sulfite oxidase [Thermomicrobiales bacterium]